MIGKLLLTGFDPFGGDETNPSWEAVRILDGKYLNTVVANGGDPGGEYPAEGDPAGESAEGRDPGKEHAVQRGPEARDASWATPAVGDPGYGEVEGGKNGWQIVVRQLPTVFGRSLEALKKAVEEENPAAVICVGQAGGRPDITVERIGINVDDARIPDNAGQQPVDVPVVRGGPAAYWATLPLKRIVEALRTAGIPASVSNSAGTFVCNHVLYGLLHYLAEEGRIIPAGFIHIPYLPEQGCKNSGQPTMCLEVVVRALELAAAETVHAAGEADILLPPKG
ncbi:Peptidase C15, pyroglutamyl peptidase I [Acididesulfobacillus acetoxydans]|uniref:Pyrrolidone-carboxylate peptidase n=1 Tax=Acididesulfobacillus acetoxydans TaxID=1561005 RepID=A0A8S0WKR0_9FIRM|nr:pyroglutamyl-peptidase I [Acididesulfobacillus acetoxydans]CAA7599534.1 Peptidase C15, pyroglutamyl peptidase I [Acididesulfobacillus acetoxydans]CEJ07729.1 Pyrrolidone-carboxylate peptidase [Acididesulfobacillus acetoxydans]